MLLTTDHREINQDPAMLNWHVAGQNLLARLWESFLESVELAVTASKTLGSQPQVESDLE
jgi:hypothetical protein